MTPRIYGWRPQLADNRDRLFTPPPSPTGLPALVDLRPSCPPVYDQGQIGSCTANAIAGALQFTRRKEGRTPDFNPSRLFIYYGERNIEHTVHSDAGAIIRDGIKVVNQLGAPPETEWPYDGTPADPATGTFPPHAHAATKPSAKAFKDALNYQATSYLAIPGNNVDQMRACLAAGFPFVFGFVVYDSFESQAVAANGMVPMPKNGEKQLGGHAVCAVGYDDHAKRMIVRNSWGPGWGDKGYFHMPYDYFADPGLSSDFWTLRVVE